jgi:uncharacterized MAPEG superfamily protein
MPLETALISLDNPVFHTYALAATIMILKLMLQPWITVQRMMKVNAGFRSPEDAKKTPLNPLNDLESIPGFLAAGFFFVLAAPPLLLAQILIWTYVTARACHFVAYATAQIHDIRATLWTFSSLSVIAMAGYALFRII